MAPYPSAPRGESLYALRRIPNPLLLVICVLILPLIFNACSSNLAHSADDWVSVGSPPTGAASIVWVQDSTIWVRSHDGALFTTTVTGKCEAGPDCWPWLPANEAPVDHAGSFKPKRSPECKGLEPDNPAPNPPNGTVLECVFVVQHAGETNEFIYFALMPDGNVMYLDNTPSGIPWICVFSSEEL